MSALELQAAATASAPRAPARGAVEVVEGAAGLAALRGEWDATVARGPVDQPYHRHAFLTAWVEAFAPAARLRVLVARDAAGRATGLAPFLEERRAGLTVLSAPANDHTPRFEWALGEDPEGAVAALWAHLRDRVRWDVLVLRDVPRHGPTSTLIEAAARRDRHRTGRWESLRSPFLALAPGAPREGQLTAKFAANLRRRLRKLGEAGAVALRRVDAGAPLADVERFVEEFLALEASGWKGAEGTAIARDPRVAAFYRGLVRVARREGWLALRALDVDGRPVAMHLGLFHRGVYSLPKPAYDERLAPCSPGQLLFREVVLEHEARGAAEVDFLGPDMPWKRDWEPAFRPHDWLYVYRPGVTGAALHAVKHRLKPWLKEAIAWSRR